jgi:hypothetical protein
MAASHSRPRMSSTDTLSVMINDFSPDGCVPTGSVG